MYLQQTTGQLPTCHISTISLFGESSLISYFGYNLLHGLSQPLHQQTEIRRNKLLKPFIISWIATLPKQIISLFHQKQDEPLSTFPAHLGQEPQKRNVILRHTRDQKFHLRMPYAYSHRARSHAINILIQDLDEGFKVNLYLCEIAQGGKFLCADRPCVLKTQLIRGDSPFRLCPVPLPPL